jgi:hypothetical protein
MEGGAHYKTAYNDLTSIGKAILHLIIEMHELSGQRKHRFFKDEVLEFARARNVHLGGWRKLMEGFFDLESRGYGTVDESDIAQLHFDANKTMIQSVPE